MRDGTVQRKSVRETEKCVFFRRWLRFGLSLVVFKDVTRSVGSIT